MTQNSGAVPRLPDFSKGTLKLIWLDWSCTYAIGVTYLNQKDGNILNQGPNFFDTLDCLFKFFLL